MRRIGVVLAAVAASMMLFTTGAGAQQSGNASECSRGGPTGAQYPPQCASPRADRSVVAAGEAVRLTGQCEAVGRVDFRLQPGGASLGSAQTDQDGNFNANLTIPSSTQPGSYTIEYLCTAVQGASFQRGADIQVRAAAARAAALPRTGNGLTMPLAVSALLLLAAGSLAVFATRRRQA